MGDKSQAESFFDLFQQFGRNLQLPNAQIKELVELNKKNIEAMQEIARTTSSGTQTLILKQREALEQTLGEISRMVQGSMSSGDPGQMISDQAEFARRSFEITITNAAEMSEIVRDSGTESYNILKKRVEDSIEEIRGTMENEE